MLKLKNIAKKKHKTVQILSHKNYWIYLST